MGSQRVGGILVGWLVIVLGGQSAGPQAPVQRSGPLPSWPRQLGPEWRLRLCLRVRGGGDCGLGGHDTDRPRWSNYEDDFPTLGAAVQAAEQGCLSSDVGEEESGYLDRGLPTGEEADEEGAGAVAALWDVKEGEGLGLWSGMHFMVLRHVPSGAALELPRDAEDGSFIFRTHAGGETRAYLGSGTQDGIAFVPSERCPRVHQALASAPGSNLLARSLVRPSSKSSTPAEKHQDAEWAGGWMAFGRWRIEILQVQDGQKLILRHGSAHDDWIELVEHGFVLSCRRLEQALVVECRRMQWISMDVLQEAEHHVKDVGGRLLDACGASMLEGEAHEEASAGGEEGSADGGGLSDRGLDLLAEGGAGLGDIDYDGELEPYEATMDELHERGSEEEEAQAADEARRMRARFYECGAEELDLLAREKASYAEALAAAGIAGGPALETVDYDTYYKRRAPPGGGRQDGPEGFYHPTKGLDHPLNQNAHNDPTTVPEFQYKGVTLAGVCLCVRVRVRVRVCVYVYVCVCDTKRSPWQTSLPPNLTSATAMSKHGAPRARPWLRLTRRGHCKRLVLCWSGRGITPL
jgi:hypothetical protein